MKTVNLKKLNLILYTGGENPDKVPALRKIEKLCDDSGIYQEFAIPKKDRSVQSMRDLFWEKIARTCDNPCRSWNGICIVVDNDWACIEFNILITVSLCSERKREEILKNYKYKDIYYKFIEKYGVIKGDDDVAAYEIIDSGNDVSECDCKIEIGGVGYSSFDYHNEETSRIQDDIRWLDEDDFVEEPLDFQI